MEGREQLKDAAAPEEGKGCLSLRVDQVQLSEREDAEADPGAAGGWVCTPGRPGAGLRAL